MHESPDNTCIREPSRSLVPCGVLPVVKIPGQAMLGWLVMNEATTEPSPTSNTGPKTVHRQARLSNTGHLLLAMSVVSLACSGFLIFRKDAQNRLQKLEYCQRETAVLQQAETAAMSPMVLLAKALPSATPLQKQRLLQQADELIALNRYHCQSMELISTTYQSLVSVANVSAMVSATMLALLSVHGLKGEITWPVTVLGASAFTLGIAVVSIQTFNLNDNLRTSRALYEQTVALKRYFATSIANQESADARQHLNLLNPQDLAAFMKTVDQRLSNIDTPAFAMNDSFALKEALLLLRNASSTSPPTPQPDTSKP